MRNTDGNGRRSDLRGGLLTGAALLALALGAPAFAQQQGGSGQAQAAQGQAGQSAQVTQIRTAEQALRQAQQQLAGDQRPNFAQARTAVQAGLRVLEGVPQQVRQGDAYRTAERGLNEAQAALQGDGPNEQQATTHLREAADALGSVANRVSGSADAAGSGASGASGQRAQAQGAGAQVRVQQQAPEVTVQQPAPQITVQQPPPQVIVQQPPPQVTVQQPEPRVIVQQAEPQVRVQQAEPQVKVERQGQPQVSVERRGQAQADVRRQDRPEQAGAARADQRTGATAQTPAPAESGGAQPQRTAAATGGMALQSVQSLVGTNVVGANGREAGEVENLLIDRAGRVRAAVIEWGGFLGIGNRQAVVPIDRIQLGQGDQRARLNVTREELEALPRYERDRVAEYGRERGWGEELRLYR